MKYNHGLPKDSILARIKRDIAKSRGRHKRFCHKVGTDGAPQAAVLDMTIDERSFRVRNVMTPLLIEADPGIVTWLLQSLNSDIRKHKSNNSTSPSTASTTAVDTVLEACDASSDDVGCDEGQESSDAEEATTAELPPNVYWCASRSAFKAKHTNGVRFFRVSTRKGRDIIAERLRQRHRACRWADVGEELQDALSDGGDDA